MHSLAFRGALREVAPWITVTEGGKLEAHLNGLSTREKLRYLSKEMGLSPDLHDEIWRQKQDRTMAAIRGAIRPDHEKVDLLSSLRRMGFRLACVSNAIRSTTTAALAQAELLLFFEFVLTNEDVPKQKPDPAPYAEALRRMGLAPAQCLVVEDSPHGIESARKSGAHVMPVSTYRDVTFRAVWEAIKSLDAAPTA